MSGESMVTSPVMQNMKYFLSNIVLFSVFLFLTSGGPPVSLQQSSGDNLQHLRVRVLLEDYYDPVRAHMRTMMQQDEGQWWPRYGEGITDLVDLHLYDSPDSRIPVYSGELPLTVDGWLEWDLPSSLRGNYYVRIGHRLHEPLLSASPLPFDGTSRQEWDFTPSSARSHGQTSVAVPVVQHGDPVFYAAGSFSNRDGEPPPPPNGSTLEVRVFLQGYYGHNLTEEGDKLIQAHEQKSSGAIEPRWTHPISDRLTISMHIADNYSDIKHTQETFLMTNGWARITFPSDIGEEVWISVRHRNHIETVYFTTLDFSGHFEEITSIDFTTAASQAFGENQIGLGDGAFGIYAGDVDGNGIVDAQDRALVQSELIRITKGYLDEDVNGDGNADALDRAFVQGNLIRIISSVTP